MNHHKQVACAVTLNPEQLNMLLATQAAFHADVAKSLQSQQETNAEFKKAATAFSTWLENNPKLPSSANMSTMTSAISGLFQQTTPQLAQITKAIKDTVQEPTKGTYFKDYGLPTLGTVLSITTLVLGIVVRCL